MRAHPHGLDAPNVVPVHAKLVTSGQPTARSLADLGEQGFKAVVYLAPSSVPDAVKAEPELVASQGLEFVHHPIPFGAPRQEHFAAVSSTLQRLQEQKTLVHCQVNMRASSMVFLHRVITNKEDPSVAWDAVTRVWSPSGAWKELIAGLLAKHAIKFELL